ncbi:MAG TPA: heparinase II/III family protein, partial [Candidatus Avipropionibacterium avicola]|nr:heparinase II/III family protein [Candidatus Avipropionibacterium avicola]
TQKLALAAIAIQFPELVDNTDWRENAADFLSTQLGDVLHPDGGYAEAADGYAYGVAGSQASVQRHFEENGYALGGKEDLHRLVRFLADQTLPGGKSVGYGDSGSEDRRPSLLSHAELFEDDALLHIATDGAEGSPPDHTSVCYPDTRVAVLRDGWTPDAAYLRINADNGAHSHPDNMAVTVQAHGRQLLPELGAFTYSSDPRSNWLRRTTAAQTTVEVDGRAQDLNADGGFDVFATNPAFDLVTGWTEAQPTVRHRRTVLFVRTAPVGSGFWVVSDQLRPDDGDEHIHRQHWHFLPGAEPTVSDRSAVFSGFESGANLLIAPADSPGLSVKLGDGYHSPRFYSVTTNRHAQMTRSGTGPVVFDTLLQPTSDPTVPKSTVSRLQVTGAGGADAAAMAVDFGRGRTASYLVSHIGTGRQLSFGSCSFDGEVAWVEQQTIHRTWLLYGGRTLTIDDTPVVHSPTAFTDLAVRFTQQRGQLRIDGSGLVPSTDPEAAIRIGLAGVGRVTLNGEQVPFIESDGVVLAAAVA